VGWRGGASESEARHRSGCLHAQVVTLNPPLGEKRNRSVYLLAVVGSSEKD
jgi:hypothetical protein